MRLHVETTIASEIADAASRRSTIFGRSCSATANRSSTRPGRCGAIRRTTAHSQWVHLFPAAANDSSCSSKARSIWRIERPSAGTSVTGVTLRICCTPAAAKASQTSCARSSRVAMTPMSKGLTVGGGTADVAQQGDHRTVGGHPGAHQSRVVVEQGTGVKRGRARCGRAAPAPAADPGQCNNLRGVAVQRHRHRRDQLVHLVADPADAVPADIRQVLAQDQWVHARGLGQFRARDDAVTPWAARSRECSQIRRQTGNRRARDLGGRSAWRQRRHGFRVSVADLGGGPGALRTGWRREYTRVRCSLSQRCPSRRAAGARRQPNSCARHRREHDRQPVAVLGAQFAFTGLRALVDVDLVEPHARFTADPVQVGARRRAGGAPGPDSTGRSATASHSRPPVCHCG